jgi:hypothetical protein
VSGAIVVEIDVDLMARRGPFRDAGGPPPQVRLAIGTGVQVAGVRAVQAHIGEAGRHPQDAGQPCPAHHAVGRAAGLQQREHRLTVPARVPELHRDPDPARDSPQEPFQPGVVALLARAELNEQDRALAAQLVPAFADPADPVLGRVQPPAMGQPARRLGRQLKAWRQPPLPAAERGRARPAVEAAVQLGGAEYRRVAGQPIARRQTRRIQLRLPVVIAPARGPNEDHGILLPAGRHCLV